MIRKYKFVGDPRDYDWEENPVKGKVYGGDYTFGHSGNTLEDNFNSCSDRYFAGTMGKTDYFEFINDWEVVNTEEFVDNQLADRVKKLEDKVWKMEEEIKQLNEYIDGKFYL